MQQTDFISSKVANKCIISIHLDKNIYYAGETLTGKIILKCPIKDLPSSPLINDDSLDDILHLQNVLIEVEGSAKTQVGGLYPYFTKVDFEDNSTPANNDDNESIDYCQKASCSSSYKDNDQSGHGSPHGPHGDHPDFPSNDSCFKDSSQTPKYPSERESLGRSDNYRILHSQMVIFDVNNVEDKNLGDISPGHQMVFPFSYKLSQALQPTLKGGEGVLSGKNRRIKIGVKRSSNPSKDDPFYYAYKVIGSASISYKIHVTVKKQGLFPQTIEHFLNFPLRKKRKSDDPLLNANLGSKMLISGGERELFKCCGGRITRRSDPFVHGVMKKSKNKTLLQFLMCLCIRGDNDNDNEDEAINGEINETSPSSVPFQDLPSTTTTDEAPSRLTSSPSSDTGSPSSSSPPPSSSSPPPPSPKSDSVFVRTEVERGSYFPGEIINFACFVNNENSKIGFDGLRISFTQHLLLNIEGEPTSSFSKLLDHVILPRKILPFSKHEFRSKLKIPEFNGIIHRMMEEFPLPPYVQCRHFSNSYSLNVELILESFGGVGADPVNSIFIDVCQKPLNSPIAPSIIEVTENATTTTTLSNEIIFPNSHIKR